MCKDANKCETVAGNLVYYKREAVQSNGGSPVFRKSRGRKYIVGVHIGGQQNSSMFREVNIAVLMRN